MSRDQTELKIASTLHLSIAVTILFYSVCIFMVTFHFFNLCTGVLSEHDVVAKLGVAKMDGVERSIRKVS